LSGPGLEKIYSSLASRQGQDSESITAAAVTAEAAAGNRLAIETCNVFFALLGTVAGNLALTVGARGGIYIAGGIVPRIVALLETSDFRERFIGKGRYRRYLDAIPTSVIMIDRPAFLGLIGVLATERP
jgi:glucokinase